MINDVVERSATAATYGGSGLTVFGAVTTNEIVALGGLALAAMTFGVNWYYRHKTFQHDRKLAEAAIKNQGEFNG